MITHLPNDVQFDFCYTLFFLDWSLSFVFFFFDPVLTLANISSLYFSSDSRLRKPPITLNSHFRFQRNSGNFLSRERRRKCTDPFHLAIIKFIAAPHSYRIFCQTIGFFFHRVTHFFRLDFFEFYFVSDDVGIKIKL